MDHLIHSFRRNANEEVRITTRRYQEKDYLDIRVFFQSSKDGEFEPTRKGVTVGLEFASQFDTALEKIREGAAAGGMGPGISL